MTTVPDYPVHVDATLDRPLSRWLWVVKWVLAIPHYVILGVLWIAFAVLSVVAFVAILFTGRYPRAIFDFNVGVLRWTWRVQYYAFGALATDRYPPFSLEEVPDYPAHLRIDYPAHLSRGLVLLKWWLLAIPHYLIVGIFIGGTWLAWRTDAHSADWPGLIGITVLIAGVILAVTGRYPDQLYDFVLGMNRWVLRVAAYAGLMTDAYPPFRFDMGGHENAGTLVVPPPAGPAGPAPYASEVPPPGPAAYGSDAPPPPPGPAAYASAPPAGPAADTSLAPARPPGSGWTGWRVTSVVIGSVLVLGGLGAIAGGLTAAWYDQHRDGGYVTSTMDTRHTDGYAVVSDRIELGVPTSGWQWTRDLIGTVRIRVTGTGEAGTFVGIAPADQAGRYLAGVQRTVLRDPFARRVTTVDGTATPPTAPAAAGIWVAESTGPGTRVLTWTPTNGDWTVVIMNADASRGLTVRGDVGATVPALTGIAVGLLVGGAVLVAGGTLLVVLAVRRASGGQS